MTLRAIAQPHFAVVRLEAAAQPSLGAAAPFQTPEHVLDMLAGAQQVGGEVRAGAVVVARVRAPDRNAILAAVGRVSDLEFREDGFIAHVLETEGLRAAELAAQGNLPVGRGQVHRRLRVREAPRLDRGCSTF